MDSKELSPLVIPHQTSYSIIYKISAGGDYSLFQTKTGEIYGCGSNLFGQLCLGHIKNNYGQIEPLLFQICSILLWNQSYNNS